jgi:TPR repeat protein
LIQGCEGADDESCAAAATLLGEGKGVGKDPARAASYLQRACAGNSLPSCLALGKLQESGGPGVAKNPMLAEFSYRRACLRGSAEGCVDLGRFEYLRNPDQAKRYFDQGCARRVPLGCAMLVVGYGDQRPFFADVAQQNALTSSCNGGSVADCTLLGILQAAAKNPMGKNYLGRACTSGDRLACELQKRAK